VEVVVVVAPWVVQMVLQITMAYLVGSVLLQLQEL
jgi:hypothetical protein